MKPDEKTVEEVLKRSLPSAPRAQMEAALDRVFTRLQSDHGETVPEALPQGDSPRAARWLVPSKRGQVGGLVRVGGWWRPAITATAAVLVAALVFIMAWRHRDVYAVLEMADSSMSRIVDGNSVPVQVQGQIEAEQIVRSNGGAVLAMADGSRVEMRSQSELSFERAEDGVSIRLRTGGIIVSAAKQGSGHLYVQTKDMTVAVVGTVFVVNAANDGSRVTREMYVYLEAYEPYATTMQPLVAFATFYRDGVKVFETQAVAVTDGIARTSRAIPVRMGIPLENLPPGRYDWQVSVIEPTGRKAAFWRAPIAIVP